MSIPTPARRQYLQMKSQYPDYILLYQVGDFYETFDEDAYIASRELQIVLTARSYGDEKRVPLAGIPIHALENYVGKLIRRGYKVAICDQVEEVGKGHHPVERSVTRILTAGTLSKPNLLPIRQNNYLAAIAPARTKTALQIVDVSTGEFSATWFTADELPAALEAELQRLVPSECLLVEGNHQDAYHFPSETMTITNCPSYFFEIETARARLCRLFHVQSLDAFGCSQVPQAIAAAGAIVAYLEKMNGKLLSLLTGLRTYRTTSYMVLDAHTQRNLDLLQGARSGSAQGSLLGVMDRTITPMGARQLRRAITQPLLDLGELEARLQSVEELYESPAMRSRFTICLQRLGDLERIAGRIRQGTAVPRAMLALREYLLVIPQLYELLRGCDSPLLLELADQLDACPQVTDLIDRALTRVDEEDAQEVDGRLIRAGFRAELDELIASIRDSRRWIVSLEARERDTSWFAKILRVGFNKVFGYYIEVSNGKLNQVPADYIRKQTITSAERYITPELKEHEARILSAEERIEEMERSIYTDVLRQLSVFYSQLITTATAIAQVDVLLSFPELAAHQGYTPPVLHQETTIEISGGRHPVVEYTLDGDVFIPNDTRLEADAELGARILLLTGPNMAGKSTYLRQVALITLLAQIGSFVPARSARIGLVDRIFTRVGAEDDIASGKSTFMVEMEETAAILHHATRHSLIILDEIGRGTSTYDGLAIARAVVEHLHNVTAARTLFATHYHELASMAEELPRLRVYTMAISEDEEGEIVFLHRVTPGSIGRSYGVHVAKLAGMPMSIVRRAEEVLKQLEATKDGTAITAIIASNGYDTIHYRHNGSLVADGNDPYEIGANFIAPTGDYEWQSEEARLAAQRLEKAKITPSQLDQIDVCAITPLDALNLLFVMQRKRRLQLMNVDKQKQ